MQPMHATDGVYLTVDQGEILIYQTSNKQPDGNRRTFECRVSIERFGEIREGITADLRATAPAAESANADPSKSVPVPVNDGLDAMGWRDLKRLAAEHDVGATRKVEIIAALREKGVEAPDGPDDPPDAES